MEIVITLAKIWKCRSYKILNHNNQVTHYNINEISNYLHRILLHLIIYLLNIPTNTFINNYI